MIKVFGPDKSDELGVLDGDDGSVSLQNKSSLKTAVLEVLTVSLEYFDYSVQIQIP